MKYLQLLVMVATITLSQASNAQTVALLDEGINNDETWRARSQQVAQRCRSIDTEFTFSLDGSQTILFTGSLCSNFSTFDTSTNAAEYVTQRTFPNDILPGPDVTVPMARIGASTFEPLRHGNDVSNALWDFDRDIFHVPFTVFGYRAFTEDPAFDDSDPSFSTYGADEDPGTHVVDAMQRLANVEPNLDVNAVSISLILRSQGDTPGGDTVVNEICENGFGQTVVDDLLDKGVAVVAGLHNIDIDPLEVTWPQCLDGVIKVGGISAGTGNLGLGIGDNGIDYFAEDDTDDQVGTSFATPRIAGAFALMKNQFPLASIEDMRQALDAAHPRTFTYTFFDPVTNSSEFFERRSVRRSDLESAFAFLEQLFPPDPNPIANGVNSAIDYFDGGEYGPAYDADILDFPTVEIDFSSLTGVVSGKPSAPSTNTKNSDPVVAQASSGVEVETTRDVVVKFIGRYSVSGFRSFSLLINGAVVETFVQSFNANTDAEFTAYVDRKHFTLPGTNTILIRADGGATIWGAKDISVEFLPMIPLTLNQTDSSEYGYLQTPPRYTSARASVNIPNGNDDIVISATGWDIDVADETGVFFNGELIGHLNTGPSSDYSPRSSFLVLKENVRPGTNYIEFVQRRTNSDWIGLSDEKWAVRDIRVESAFPDLSVASVKLETKKLDSTTPFTIQTSVANIGGGTAPGSTGRILVSTDDSISPADTEIGTFTTNASSPNTSASFTLSAQTTLVNQGYYVGICIDSVEGELVTGNNCSAGVALEDQINIVPIIMMLLDDQISS